MPDRVANIFVLAEDQEHQNLVRRYLDLAGHDLRRMRLVALPGNRGSGSQYVREHFPDEVRRCREAMGRRASSVLVVMTDADNLPAVERERTLHDELGRAGCGAVDPAEPIIILIPKWQVETWIKCLLGQTVTEDDKNTDRPPVTRDEIGRASTTLFEWTRDNATIGTTCVPSLAAALPRWRRIG